MDKPVHDKCAQCVKYNANYVHIKSNEGFTNQTLHGCSSKGCFVSGDFQEFEPKPCCNTCARSTTGGAGACDYYCYDAVNRTYPNWVAKGTMGAPDAAATKAALEGSAKTSSHYQVGTKQPIEIMQEVMTPEEFQGFLRGNVIKYSLRLGHKDAAVKEAAKIEQYAKWLRMALEGNTIKPMED